VFPGKGYWLMTRWRQAGQSKKSEGWKEVWAPQGKIWVERALLSAWRLLLRGEARKAESISTDGGDWIFFVYSRKGWYLRPTDQLCKSSLPPHTLSPVASWKGHQPGELYLHFFFHSFAFRFHLLPSPFRAGCPWGRGDNFTLSGMRLISPASVAQAPPSAFPPAFFKPTPDWRPSSTGLCLLPHVSLQLSPCCRCWSQGLCFWRQLGGGAGGDGTLPPFGSLGIQNNDTFFSFVNGNHSKAPDSSWRNDAPVTGFFFKAWAPPDAQLWCLALLGDIYSHFGDSGLQAFNLRKKHNFALSAMLCSGCVTWLEKETKRTVWGRQIFRESRGAFEEPLPDP